MRFIIAIVLLFAYGCEEKQTASPLNAKPSFAKSDSVLPAEKIDTAKLIGVYAQREFNRNGGGQLFISSNGIASNSWWSAIHHQFFKGNWEVKNDTLYVHYTESHGEIGGDPDGNFTEVFVLVNKNLYEVEKGQRDSLPYLWDKLKRPGG